MPTGGYPVVPANPAGRRKPPVDPASAARRRRRVKRLLVTLGTLLAVVVLAGGITGYLYYDKATKPDRSAPDVAVDNFLRAYLVHRNDGEARLYECSDVTGLAEMQAFRADYEQIERDRAVTISFSWGRLTVTNASKDVASVATDVTVATRTAAGPQEQLVTWTFVTKNESGWRVCGATRIS